MGRISASESWIRRLSSSPPRTINLDSDLHPRSPIVFNPPVCRGGASPASLTTSVYTTPLRQTHSSTQMQRGGTTPISISSFSFFSSSSSSRSSASSRTTYLITPSTNTSRSSLPPPSPLGQPITETCESEIYCVTEEDESGDEGFEGREPSVCGMKRERIGRVGSEWKDAKVMSPIVLKFEEGEKRWREIGRVDGRSVSATGKAEGKGGEVEVDIFCHPHPRNDPSVDSTFDVNTVEIVEAQVIRMDAKGRVKGIGSDCALPGLWMGEERERLPHSRKKTPHLSELFDEAEQDQDGDGDLESPLKSRSTNIPVERDSIAIPPFVPLIPKLKSKLSHEAALDSTPSSKAKFDRKKGCQGKLIFLLLTPPPSLPSPDDHASRGELELWMNKKGVNGQVIELTHSISATSSGTDVGGEEMKMVVESLKDLFT
ncbi:hypothetical protein BT69DRAFT_1329440 [Atractiella rhizophila]|nr:hypothetical protein BT69DRAFT_1329440 [Atractiella rhizophila]